MALQRQKAQENARAFSACEDRYITIGMINGTTVVVLVVYTERKTVVRIILARIATTRETEAYYDAQKY